MWQLLHESGVPLNTSAERDIAKDMKEELCYVADDYMRELYRVNDCDVTLQKHYTLPDGHMVSVGSERFRLVCVLCVSPYCHTAFVASSALEILYYTRTGFCHVRVHAS